MMNVVKIDLALEKCEKSIANEVRSSFAGTIVGQAAVEFLNNLVLKERDPLFEAAAVTLRAVKNYSPMSLMNKMRSIFDLQYAVVYHFRLWPERVFQYK